MFTFYHFILIDLISARYFGGVMRVSILDIHLKYCDILWEKGRYSSTAASFVDEIHTIMVRNTHYTFDNELIDIVISDLRKNNNRNSTINRKLAVLFKLLRKAYSMQMITTLPAYLRLKEGNARVRFLSLSEEDDLFSAIQARNHDHYRLCVFLIDSGARVGEALALNWNDVINQRATFWITKSGKSRTVPLTGRAQDALKDCTKRRTTGPFSMVDYQRFRYDWNSAKKQIGLAYDAQVVPHILRHTCASRLVQAGIDLRRVQTFLGHQTIQMTLRYAHLATDDLNQCANALNGFANKLPYGQHVQPNVVELSPKAASSQRSDETTRHGQG